jgi:putative transposase
VIVSETTPMVLAEGHRHTMALDRSALLEVLEALKAAEVDDRIRQAAETIYQALIEAELSWVIGAVPHERTGTRMALRNGHRPRTVTTTAGDLELRIPKLRTGSFFPSLLERRRRVDQSLFAVIMEAYLHGTSTRKVDDLVKALGADSGISKSEVSRICADLDTEMAAFRDRSLAGQPFPYVFLDATYCKARVNHRVISQAVVRRHRRGRRRAPRSPRLRRWRQRGRRVLDRVLAVAVGPWPGRGAAGHLRRPRGPEGGNRLSADRCRLAAVPGALRRPRDYADQAGGAAGGGRVSGGKVGIIRSC